MLRKIESIKELSKIINKHKTCISLDADEDLFILTLKDFENQFVDYFSLEIKGEQRGYARTIPNGEEVIVDMIYARKLNPENKKELNKKINEIYKDKKNIFIHIKYRDHSIENIKLVKQKIELKNPISVHNLNNIVYCEHMINIKNDESQKQYPSLLPVPICEMAGIYRK